jgi:hypothetical protein
MPLLSDFSYGEFLFHGRGVHGFLDGLSEPAWDDIGGRLVDQQLMPETPGTGQISRMQKVVAAMSDPIDGQQLVNHPVCSHCGSGDVSYGDNFPGEFHELPAVTYTAYQRMTDAQRNLAVATAWREFAERPLDDIAEVGKSPALSEIFAVLRGFRFTAGSDIRLGSLGHLFEQGGANQAEVDWAIDYMLEKKWLVENRQPGIRPGGHCLTKLGMEAMNNWPQLDVAPLPSGRR